MNTVHYFNKIALYIFISLLFTNCISTAIFDQHSFDNTISAKVETLGLMESATEDFSLHSEAVKEHLQELQKVYEYDKRRSDNDITTKMWEVILDENRNSVAGFLDRWKQKGTMNKAFIQEAAIQVEEAFDLLLDFENAKNKKETNDIGNLIYSFISNI